MAVDDEDEALTREEYYRQRNKGSDDLTSDTPSTKMGKDSTIKRETVA